MLISLGFKEEKLFFILVKDKFTSTHHMVLGYFPDGFESGLILDNLSFKVLPIKKRDDLKFNLFFNTTGVYKIKNKAHFEKVKQSYVKFNDLLQKIEKEKQKYSIQKD